MKKVLFIICTCLLAALYSACERRPLTYDYYPYADLIIKVDWSESFSLDNKPTGVSVWFYPKDGSKVIKTYSADVDNHKVALRAGEYDFVVFNMTPYELSSTIGFRGDEDLATLEVYSREALSSREPTQTRGTLVEQPADFAVTVYRGLIVTQQMVDETTKARDTKSKTGTSNITTVVEVTPQLANKRHAIKVRIKGFQNLADNGAYGELSGLAEGFLIDKGVPNSINARQKLVGWTQKREEGEYSLGEITIEYTTWGLYNNTTFDVNDYDYWKGLLELILMLVDNKTKKEFSINLDKDNLKIYQNDTNAEVNIEILIEIGFEDDESILLPDVEPSEGGASGFDPNVNPWDEEDVPIIIG